MTERVVIVGAGQAAVQAIDVLRRQHFAGAITLIGEESSPPYQRPPLSKGYLAGTTASERLLLRPRTFYEQRAVTTLFGRRVEEIARPERRLRLDDGRTVPYDALLLATGSRARALALPGADLDPVLTLRTAVDADRIRAGCAMGGRVVIVGGGYIGLEVAATLRAQGAAVTVLELAGRVLSRVACPPVSAFYTAEHERRGVRIVCGARVREIVAHEGRNRVRAVITEDGAAHLADVVVIGAGAEPASALAAAAGLPCSDGIEVDEYCRTSDPSIYAAGDCTHHPSLHYGRKLRLESVDNAFEQGASAALNLMGRPTPHDKVPWFWSDQYDLKLVIVGVSAGYDELVLRGDPATRAFTVCYLRDGELIAVDSVNTPKDQLAARKLIAARARPDPQRLADPGRPLQDGC
jgi:3-phenylpropionate/trans-cinnamate dioxygenase ferredoxin reductase subunit